MTQIGAKRCVCGHSTHYPICDGSHQAADWACVATSVEMVRDAFVASPHLSNLADRLAHRFQGISLHAISGAVRTRRLVILIDGIGLDAVQTNLELVHADETFVIGVGVETRALSWAFDGARFASVPSEPHTALWTSVQSILEGAEGAEGRTEQVERPKVFLSHGVVDEGLIYPALATLREHFNLDIFLCADSILPGANWRAEILDQVQRCDVFLLLCSAQVVSSVYCAFEAGLAVGLGKETRVISIDGSSVPLHLADAQAIDIGRLMERKPWLTKNDAIIDAILTAVLSATTSPQ